MKKIFLAILMLTAAILALASCLPETPDPPEGVWVSDEPRIVLFLMPEYQIPRGMPEYIGLYKIDDTETKVFVRFGNGLEFEIRDYTRRCIATGAIVASTPILLYGTYRVVRDEIHWTLTPYFQEQTGMRTIVLHRVENYDSIDPYDWSPYFFPRTEEGIQTP